MSTFEYSPIGVVHTPFTEREGMPIQPAGAKGVQGTIELFEEYHDGLKDLDGFSHLILIYHFHQSSGFKMQVTPFMDSTLRGVFSTRAPSRPNPIGLSIVKLNRIEDGVLFVENLDLLDGTPLLDIKPYVPKFDQQTQVKTGWLEQTKSDITQHKADDRFK